jgi:hypothetical protein
MPYKQFTNGSPLPASDLNTYLMNQSVMVFASSTARSAALTAPTEGMVTYLEDTNKVEVYTGSPLAWTDINDNSAAIPKSTVTATGDLIVGNGNASVTRLGIGSNGQVLSSNGTTVTWTTPSSGGLTTISTTTLSGTTTSLTSIPGTYKALQLFITNPTHDASGGVTETIAYRFNADNGNNYYVTGFDATSRTQAVSANRVNGIFVTGVNGLNAMGFLELWGYASGAKKRFSVWGSTWDATNTRADNASSWGLWNSTSAITSIDIITNTGSQFTGGTATLYGVN